MDARSLLRQAWLQRSWHVIVAEPGSGKTMGIGDLRDEAARQAGMVGGRRYPVLAVTAPKNDPREAALGNLLLLALGVGARGRWSERKYLLYDLLGQYGVECLMCDDGDLLITSWAKMGSEPWLTPLPVCHAIAYTRS